MLHELLVALWGGSTTNILQILETDVRLATFFHGLFLVLHIVLSHKTHESAELATYSHPGERALITKILNIAEDRNSVRTFINTHTSISDSSNTSIGNSKTGLYLRALCDGMDEAIKPYREEIIELEKIVLNDAYTPLTLILSRLQKYIPLFAVLNSIVRQIQTQQIHGCKLLQCLHREMHTGIPEVRQALEKMLYCCHVVFYKHLSSWLLYGYLEDDDNEFFIQKSPESRDSNMLDHSKMSSDKSFRRFNSDMWDYDIQINMLPTYIRPSLAANILSIGQTIIMFGNDPRQKKDISISTAGENSIWGEKEYEHFHKLQKLQNQKTFNAIEFECTVDELKRCVTEHLWRVAVEEAQLMQQIKLIKDFFLLGRGELFLELIRTAGHILNKKPTNHTSRDITVLFQTAIRKMQLHDESTTESFNFVVPVPIPEPPDTKESEATELSRKECEDIIDKCGWGLIQLQYKVIWPLHLLFSPAALDDYNTLFRFLLRVKKTQINLENLWIEHMKSKNVDIGVMQLRNNLMFVVNNLQYYLQVDVLESQYAIMENTMRNTRNFEDIQKSHSIFLANIMSQTFLAIGPNVEGNPVKKLIKILLLLCDDFIVKTPTWELGNLLAIEREELKVLAETLDNLMDWLTETLNKVRAQPAGAHLAQLLLRLNFNRWFTAKV